MPKETIIIQKEKKSIMSCDVPFDTISQYTLQRRNEMNWTEPNGIVEIWEWHGIVSWKMQLQSWQVRDIPVWIEQNGKFSADVGWWRLNALRYAYRMREDHIFWYHWVRIVQMQPAF